MATNPAQGEEIVHLKESSIDILLKAVPGQCLDLEQFGEDADTIRAAMERISVTENEKEADQTVKTASSSDLTVSQSAQAPLPGFSLLKLPLHLPTQAPLPTKHNTYRHPQQQALLDIWTMYDSMEVLMCAIRKTEASIQPDWTSRLMPHAAAVNEGCAKLLYSLPRIRLQAFLENTYIPTAIQSGWHVAGPDSHSNGFIDPPTISHRGEPGVYVDFLSPRSGLPLTRDQFILLVEAIQLLSNSAPPTTCDTLASRLTDDNGLAMYERVQSQWRKRHTEQGRTSQPFTEDDEQCLHRDIHALPVRTACISSEWPHIKPMSISARCRDRMVEWATAWRTMIDETPKHVVYFPLSSEACYHCDMFWAMHANETLSCYPDLRNVLLITAITLFPELDFVIYSTVVLRVYEPKHATFAQCIAYAINMVYEAIGGFSEDLAWLHTTAQHLAKKSDSFWKHTRTSSMQREVERVIQHNQKREKVRCAELKQQLEAHREMIDQLRGEIDRSEESGASESDTEQAKKMLEQWEMINEAVGQSDWLME